VSLLDPGRQSDSRIRSGYYSYVFSSSLDDGGVFGSDHCGFSHKAIRAFG